MQEGVVHKARVEHSGVSPHKLLQLAVVAQRGLRAGKSGKGFEGFTLKVSEVKSLNYWSRLKHLKINSVQRRIERYKLEKLENNGRISS